MAIFLIILATLWIVKEIRQVMKQSTKKRTITIGRRSKRIIELLSITHQLSQESVIYQGPNWAKLLLKQLQVQPKLLLKQLPIWTRLQQQLPIQPKLLLLQLLPIWTKLQQQLPTRPKLLLKQLPIWTKLQQQLPTRPKLLPQLLPICANLLTTLHPRIRVQLLRVIHRRQLVSQIQSQARLQMVLQLFTVELMAPLSSWYKKLFIENTIYFVQMSKRMDFETNKSAQAKSKINCYENTNPER